jgi:hypothetical protein
MYGTVEMNMKQGAENLAQLYTVQQDHEALAKVQSQLQQIAMRISNLQQQLSELQAKPAMSNAAPGHSSLSRARTGSSSMLNALSVGQDANRLQPSRPPSRSWHFTLFFVNTHGFDLSGHFITNN